MQSAGPSIVELVIMGAICMMVVGVPILALIAFVVIAKKKQLPPGGPSGGA